VSLPHVEGVLEGQVHLPVYLRQCVFLALLVRVLAHLVIQLLNTSLRCAILEDLSLPLRGTDTADDSEVLIMKSINLEFAELDVESLDEFLEGVVALTHQLLSLLLRENTVHVVLRHFEVREDYYEYFPQVARDLN
jgi:hypothetical protein